MAGWLVNDVWLANDGWLVNDGWLIEDGWLVNNGWLAIGGWLDNDGWLTNDGWLVNSDWPTELEAVCGVIGGLAGPRRRSVLALVETPFRFGFEGILKIIK